MIEILRTWREITDAVGLTPGPWQWWATQTLREDTPHPRRSHPRTVLKTQDDWGPSPEDATFLMEARTAMPALLTAVESVLKEHEESWSCGNPRHTNPEVGCPECWVECDTCGCTYPCVTVMAIRDALGGAQ